MRVFITAVALLLMCGTAQAQTYIGPDQALRLEWDAGNSNPPDEAYKVRLLSEASPTSTQISEIMTPTAQTQFDVPYTALPEGKPFFVTVRAVRLNNSPGESGDSNVIGPFVKGTAVLVPTGLSGTVVPKMQ